VVGGRGGSVGAVSLASTQFVDVGLWWQDGKAACGGSHPARLVLSARICPREAIFSAACYTPLFLNATLAWRSVVRYGGCFHTLLPSLFTSQQKKPTLFL
jgi:hypothetical protein